MRRILTTILGIITLFFIIQFYSCKEEKSITEPQNSDTMLEGSIDLPFELSEVTNLKISFGQEEYTPNSEGDFSFSCNENIAGMAIVYDNEDIPLLLGLVSNSKTSSGCRIDIHSTALSLAFLNPFICVSDPEIADMVIKKLENLPELVMLENILVEKFKNNIKALTTEDAEIKSALKNLILSYINSISPDTSKTFTKINKTNEVAVIIRPVNIVSGHQVKHIGKAEFTISNSYGRWARCILPDDDIYLSPNNDLVSYQIWNPSIDSWKPSIHNIELIIIPNEEPKEINVYGLGYKNEKGSQYKDLSTEEIDYVLNAGLMTVLIEFVPRILSLATNFPFTFGPSDVSAIKADNIIRWSFLSTKIYEKGKLYMYNDEYSTFCWEMTKEFISLLITDDDFRDMFLTELGITLSKNSFEIMGRIFLLPLDILYIADDLTGLAKSVLALHSASLKTTFKVYSEEFNFGNVNGNVFDKDDNTAIQGVKVELMGDDDNPLNPNHIYTTDANGGFWFENIGEGNKSLVASKAEYGAKTVEIEVEKEKTSEVLIELSKEKGLITGKVLNQIFLDNNITPANFNKECHIDITEIGGNEQQYPFWISEYDNGTYSKTLTPGTYEIKVWHEDYKETKTTVTIAGDQTTKVEDLILVPDGKMEGRISFDIDFDGKYEETISFTASETGADISETGTCTNNSTRYGLVIAGLNLSEKIVIMIDTSQVKESNVYPLGGLEYSGCVGLNGKTSVLSSTEKFLCTHEEYGYQEYLAFGLPSDDQDECNCGITSSGNIFLTQYGINLTDVIEGSIVATLPGWNNCHCPGKDKDGNPMVDCATTIIDVSFKLLVGTINNVSTNNETILNSIEELIYKQ